MSSDSEVKPITVTIFDKDYVVGCKENEREALFASVQFLNKKMVEQRDNGKVIGAERIAVMSALNIAHEYLSAPGAVGQKKEIDYAVDSSDAKRRIANMGVRIGTVLAPQQQLDF